MQIHEITHRRINEAGILGQLGSNIATGLANKLLPGSAPDPALVGTPVAANQRQAAAGQMNKTLLAPLAKEMQNRWAQTVQQLLVKSVDKATGAPVTSASQIDRAALEKEMNMFINSVAGFDLANLGDLDDGSGQAKQLEADLKPQIVDAIKDTQSPVKNAKVWLSLATSIQRAKSIRQFSAGGKNAPVKGGVTPAALALGPNGTTTFNGKPYNKGDPTHRLAVKLGGGNPDTYPK